MSHEHQNSWALSADALEAASAEDAAAAEHLHELAFSVAPDGWFDPDEFDVTATEWLYPE